MSGQTSFKIDILPLFTELDIKGMSRAFDLTDYKAVKAHAQAIHDRIRGIGGAVMPPPPPVGDGPWPQSNIVQQTPLAQVQMSPHEMGDRRGT